MTKEKTKGAGVRASRTENAKRIIVYNLLRQTLDMLVPFAMRSIMIYTLGTLYLGVNGLFTSILQVLSLAELGFGEAMIFSMYKPFAENDRDRVCALMKLYRDVYRVIGAVVLAVGLCVMPFLRRLISGEVPPDINIYIVYGITLAHTVMSYLLFPYRPCMYYADQRADTLSRISMVVQVIDFSAKTAVLCLLRSYYLYCMVSFVSMLVNCALIARATRRDYLLYRCAGEIPEEEKRSIWNKIAGLFVNKVCYVFRNAFDSITVSAFLGLTAVSIFQNYYMVISGITKVSVILSGGIVAGVGNSMVLESQKKNYQDFRKLQLLFMWFAGWCTVCLLCLYQPFMRLWMGAERMLPLSAVCVFCVYYFTDMAGNLCFVYRQAAGLYEYRRWVPVLESIVNVMLNVVLVRRFGVIGVLLSTIFCQLGINLLWSSGILFDHYFTDYKRRDYLVRLGLYALSTLCACAVTGSVCRMIPLSGILLLFTRGCVCLVMPNIVLFALLSRFPEFGEAKVFVLKKILKRSV